MEGLEHVTRFTLGGLLFEYDPEKTEEILKNTEFLLKAPQGCSLITTALSSMTNPTARTRTAMIQSARYCRRANYHRKFETKCLQGG